MLIFWKKKRSKGWTETTAAFTGRYRRKTVNAHMECRYCEYNEYEISYCAENKKMKGWYSFYPVPDPAPEDLEGQTMRIRYNEKRPFDFEIRLPQSH